MISSLKYVPEVQHLGLLKGGLCCLFSYFPLHMDPILLFLRMPLSLWLKTGHLL